MSIRSVGAIGVILNAKVGGFNASIRGAQNTLLQFGATANSVGASSVAMGSAITRAALPLAAIGGFAVFQFSKFEAGMRNVNSIAKQSEEQLKRTSRAALDLAVELGSSPVGLTEALYNINSASFQGAAGLNVLRHATIAAKAGLATTEQSAQAITAVLNAYSLGAEHAADVSDILFKTVEKGVLSFSDLAGGLGAIVSTGKAVGVEFDEIAAGIATMTRGGIQSAEAFTAMNRFLLRFITGTAELDSLFQTYGFYTADVALHTLGLGKTIKILARETGGAAKEITNLGFKMRGFKAASSLVRNEGKDFAGDLIAQADRAGAALAALEEQSKSVAFQWSRIKAQFQVAAIEIGEKLAPTLRTIGNVLAWLGEKWSNLSERTKTLIVTISSILVVAGPLLIIFGKLAMLVGTLATVVGGALASGFLLWAGLLAGVVVGLVSVYGEGETLMDKFKTILTNVITWFKGASLVIQEVAIGIAVYFKTGLKQAWLFFEIFFHNIIEGYSVIGVNIFKFMTWFANNWSEVITSAGLLVGSLVVNMTTNFKSFFQWLIINWSSLWTGIAQFTGGVIVNMSENIKEFFGAVWKWVKGGFTDWEAPDLKGLSEDVYFRVTESNLTPMLDGYKSTITDSLEFTKGEYRSLIDESSDLWLNASDELKSKLTEISSVALKEVENVTKAAESIVEDADFDQKIKSIVVMEAGAVQKGTLAAAKAEATNNVWRRKQLNATDQTNYRLDTLIGVTRAGQDDEMVVRL